MSTVPVNGLTNARPALDAAVETWNAHLAELWGVGVKIDNERLAQCIVIAEHLFDGKHLPKAPGPFKRLAGYAVATQYLSPFTWTKSDGTQLTADEQKYWEPRLAIWVLPFLSEILKLNGEYLEIPIAFPTLHSQIEVLNYLRNLFVSEQGHMKIADDVLLERVTLVGLILETSAYAAYPDTTRLKPITAHAKSCVEQYAYTDLRWPDLHFMNEEFLENAVGIGAD